MATYIPVTNLPTQFFDADGAPLTGGSLEFYLAGTTTATDLFSDSSGTSIGESIDLNSLGYPESGGNLITLFRDQSRALKIVCLDSVGATIYTMDNIPAVASFDSAASAKLAFITVTQDVDLDTMESDIAALLPASGGTITGNIVLGPGVFLQESVTAGITASTTQVQTEQPLISGVNQVAVVANSNDTVTLPTAVTGIVIKIINDGANTLQIFPAADDAIDGAAADASITLSASSVIELTAYSSVNWTTTTSTNISEIPAFKSYSFVSRDAANGENWSAGFYDYSTTDANLTQASLTVTHGGSNVPYAAHAFCVLGGAGTTDGSDLILTVSGTSIDDAGTRTGSDTEVIVADGTAGGADEYYETNKKWLGTITYTLSSSGGTTYALDFNYGLCKYEDFGNRDFTMTDFECVGLCNSNENGFEIDLLKHSATGWTYATTGFVAGNTPVATMTTIHGVESDLDAGDYFAFKRAALTTDILGAASEGVLVRVTTSVNNSVSYMDAHIGVVF